MGWSGQFKNMRLRPVQALQREVISTAEYGPEETKSSRGHVPEGVVGWRYVSIGSCDRVDVFNP